MGDTIGTGIHDEDRERVLTEWASALATGIEFDCEFRVVQPSGDTLWVRAHGAHVLGVDGDDPGSVGTVADITARVESEQAQRAAEELFRTSFESSPVGIALVDVSGCIARANRALSELTGYPPDDLVAMPALSILHPEDIGSEQRGLGAAGVDQRIVRADGTIRWASIRHAQIRNAGADSQVLTLAQFVDTTERRQFEDRLAHMANHDPLTGLMNRRSSRRRSRRTSATAGGTVRPERS
jgi:PAS domain S-box-containing protein